MAKPTSDWPASLTLHEWQRDALTRFRELTEEAGQRDFLCAATPGAGKTTFALSVAHRLLAQGQIERIVAVVPTAHLEGQWQRAAGVVGIQLSEEISNRDGLVAPDYHGPVLTYAQVAKAPEIHRAQCQRPTLVILDEPHHAGASLSWGDGVRRAFEQARYRLSITGTPFRSDSNAIPFVRYEQGRSVADYSYGYGQAIADKVCRPAYFPTYEGTMTWWTSADGETTASFAEELSEEEQRRRLRTAVAADGQFMERVLTDADARLSDLRRSLYNLAGGLVIAGDDSHARQLAKLLQRISGTAPAVATSYDPDASRIIKRFRDGTDRWLVAVRMVSEGVDIPRLFVGVYASYTLTELFFRQAVGRFVRWLPYADLTDQPAYLYMPRDPYLLQYAQQIAEERNHALDAPEGEPVAGQDDAQSVIHCGPGRSGALFTPMASEAEASDVVLSDKDRVTATELLFAQQLMQRVGARGIPEEFARVVREAFRVAETAPAVTATTPDEPAPLPLAERKIRIRQRINNLVARFRGVVEWDYQTAQNLINSACGIPTRPLASLEQLECAETLAKYLVTRSGDAEARYIDDWLSIARRFVADYERDHGSINR